MRVKKEDKSNKDSNCTCPESWCPRHGNCIECQKYHHENKEKSFCGK